MKAKEDEENVDAKMKAHRKSLKISNNRLYCKEMTDDEAFDTMITERIFKERCRSH